MRAWCLIAVVFACGQPTPSAPVGSAAKRLERHIPASIVTVRQYGLSDPTIAMIGGMGADQVPCFMTLARRVVGSFALEDASRELTVIVLEGNLPRAELEACIPGALKSAWDITVERDGEHAVFDVGELGKLYVTWRDGFVFASSKAGIDAVLSGARSREPWAERLAKLPPGKMVAASTDPILGTLLRVPSPGYDLVMDDLGAERGKLSVRFGSNDDATRAARQITSNTIAWPSPPPPRLGEELAKLPVVVRDATLEIEFDIPKVAKVVGEELYTYGKQLVQPGLRAQPAQP
ncbi:MAG: hypothetical protein WKG01_33845 [Kofleriaceae bacterium]